MHGVEFGCTLAALPLHGQQVFHPSIAQTIWARIEGALPDRFKTVDIDPEKPEVRRCIRNSCRSTPVLWHVACGGMHGRAVAAA